MEEKLSLHISPFSEILQAKFIALYCPLIALAYNSVALH